MKKIRPFRGLPLALVAASLGNASAALVVINGGFEANALGSGGTQGAPTGWFVSDANTTNDFVARYDGNFAGVTNPSTNKAAIDFSGGYYYQALGVLGSETSVGVTLDAYQILNAGSPRNFGELRFTLLAGTPATAAAIGNKLLGSPGLSVLGTLTVSQADLGFAAASAAGSALEKLGYEAGSISLAGASTGTTIWLFIDSPTADAAAGAAASRNEPWFDNVSVTAVPEPASMGLALGALALIRRRCRR